MSATTEVIGDKYTDIEAVRALLPKKWKGCRYGSFDFMKEVRHNRTAELMVWPDEGRFDDKGIWQFNDKHEGFEPLLIDMQTANMLCIAHDAISSDEVRTKFVDWIAKGRGHFGRIVEIGWGCVK